MHIHYVPTTPTGTQVPAGKTVTFQSRHGRRPRNQRRLFVDVPTTHEGLTLLKDMDPPLGAIPSWSRTTIVPMSASSAELEAVLLHKPWINVTESYENLKSVRQQREIERVLKDKQASEQNSRAKWSIAGIEEERGPHQGRQGSEETKAIHVILRRQLKPGRRVDVSPNVSSSLPLLPPVVLHEARPSHYGDFRHETQPVPVLEPIIIPSSGSPYTSSASSGPLNRDHPRPVRPWNEDTLPRLVTTTMSPVIHTTRGYGSDARPSRRAQDYTFEDGASTTYLPQAAYRSGNPLSFQVDRSVPAETLTMNLPGAYRSPTVEDASDDDSTEDSFHWSEDSGELSTATSTPTSNDEAAVFVTMSNARSQPHRFFEGVDAVTGTQGPHSYHSSPSMHHEYDIDSNAYANNHLAAFRSSPHDNMQPIQIDHMRHVVEAPAGHPYMADVEKYERAYIRKLEKLCRAEAYDLRDKLRRLKRYEERSYQDMKFSDDCGSRDKDEWTDRDSPFGRAYEGSDVRRYRNSRRYS